MRTGRGRHGPATGGGRDPFGEPGWWAGRDRETGAGPRAGRGFLQAPPPHAVRRLAPLYASARVLWLLVALAALGLLAHFLPASLRAALVGRLRTLLPWA